MQKMGLLGNYRSDLNIFIAKLHDLKARATCIFLCKLTLMVPRKILKDH